MMLYLYWVALHIFQDLKKIPIIYACIIISMIFFHHVLLVSIYVLFSILTIANAKQMVQLLTHFVLPQRGHPRAQFPFVPWQRGHFPAQFGSPQARYYEGKHLGEGGKYIC